MIRSPCDSDRSFFRWPGSGYFEWPKNCTIQSCGAILLPAAEPRTAPHSPHCVTWRPLESRDEREGGGPAQRLGRVPDITATPRPPPDPRRTGVFTVGSQARSGLLRARVAWRTARASVPRPPHKLDRSATHSGPNPPRGLARTFRSHSSTTRDSTTPHHETAM